MGTVKDIYEIFLDLLSRRVKKDPSEKPSGSASQIETSEARETRGTNGITWEQYDRLFDIQGYKVPYIPIINDWKGKIAFLDSTQLIVNTLPTKFLLPEEFMNAPLPSDAYDGPCCRLSDYSFNTNTLTIELQETSYYDYFGSGEHLDAPFPSKPTITNREAFGRVVEKGGELWPFTHLTNICGVGLILKTSDNKILVGKVPKTSHVYPGRQTFSTAGIMKWPEESDPFQAIKAKSIKRIKHTVDPNNTRLLAFGVDARKLYFQFSFLEDTMLSTDDIISGCGSDSLTPIPLELEELINQITNECWEPCAEAALLTICVKEFGKEEVCRSLFSRRSLWEKREMRDEWDYRASRPGDLPDMSLRYEPEKLQAESKKYVNAVMEFMGTEIDGADVVEVGCGTGRITEELLAKAGNLTCVEFCERMIQRSSKRLMDRFNPSRYVMAFGQSYYPRQRHEIAVCSLVLVHNVNEADYRQLVKSLCRMARIVYVFEDISIERKTSPRTFIRSTDKIIKSFKDFGFSLTHQRKPTYRLFDDEIAFMKFTENEIKSN